MKRKRVMSFVINFSDERAQAAVQGRGGGKDTPYWGKMQPCGDTQRWSFNFK